MALTHVPAFFPKEFLSLVFVTGRYTNQSTESADGGGFLNFYTPLEYISSVLSFCSIFLIM